MTTVNISLQPEALALIQFSLGRLALDLEEHEGTIVDDEVDASMRENIQGLYLHIDSILTGIAPFQ
ncbi:hypothetical protein ACTXKV_14185 [Psychrobacter cibarius]|jgi:hypothetical protein|uniref:hypothetical protein n=1 Tax=Psychrobacter cibarius TaxID=282669 RepID=UPI003FD00B99